MSELIESWKPVNFLKLLLVSLTILINASIHASTSDWESNLEALVGKEKVAAIIRLTGDNPRYSSTDLLPILQEGLRICEQEADFASKIALLQNGAILTEIAGDLSLAEKFLIQAELTGKELGDSTEQSKTFLKLGEFYVRDQRLEQGINSFTSALEHFEQVRNANEAIDTIHKISICYAMLGQEKQAVEYMEKALSASVALNDLVYLGRSYQTKGIIFLILDGTYSFGVPGFVKLSVQQLKKPPSAEKSHQHSHHAALEPLETAISYFEESGDHAGKAECLRLKGDILRATGNLTGATSYYQKAFRKHAIGGSDPSYINLLISQATTETIKENFEKAFRSMDTAIQLSKGNSNAAWLHLLKAEIALKEFNDPLAQQTLETGIKAAKKSHALLAQEALYRLLSQVQINLGDYEKGIHSHDLANSYTLQLVKAKFLRKIEGYESRIHNWEAHSVTQNESQIHELESRLNDYRNYIKTGLIISLTFGACGLGVLLFRVGLQKKAESNLQSAKARIGELESLTLGFNDQRNAIFKALAQELRTPMSGIMGTVPLLNDTSMNSLQENCINIIDISSRSILTLINDISDLSKLDSGGLKLKKNPFNIISISETVVQLFETGSTHTKVELLCDMPSDPIPLLKGDADRIQQIILTLVGRGLQTTFNGHVSLRVETLVPKSNRKLNIRITIEDTGEGMDEKAIKEIFELSPNHTNINFRHSASMLGMSITQKLVKTMHGNIDIESINGKGLKISVLLPFILDPSEDSWNTPSQFERFPRKRALLIDPSLKSQKIICKHLRAWGLDIECANNTEIAEQFISSKHTFDVVLIDTTTNKDDLNTLEKVSFIRNSEYASETPIIIMAHLPTMKESYELKRQKYVHHISKPIRVVEFHSTLQNAIHYKTPLTPSFASLKPESTTNTLEESDALIDSSQSFDFIPYILPFKSNAKIDPNLKILLAEDNLVNQRVTTLMLKKIGYTIDVVSHGKEAVDALKEGKYDVVLMDKVMPIMDGLETTLNIRKLKEIEQPIIIALTASASMEDEIACRKATMDNFLAKPVPFEKMKAALAFATSMLERRRKNKIT